VIGIRYPDRPTVQLVAIPTEIYRLTKMYAATYFCARLTTATLLRYEPRFIARKLKILGFANQNCLQSSLFIVTNVILTCLYRLVRRPAVLKLNVLQNVA
jgi:hypothetical protein